MPRTMLTDTVDEIVALDELAEIDRRIIHYRTMCKEFNDLRNRFNKINQPHMRAHHWKEISPMQTELNTMKAKINALEIELKEHLL